MCRIGPTGKFPDGELSNVDEGELQLAITPMSAANVVRIDFGVQISWIALRRKDAFELARILEEAALKLRVTEQ